MEKLGFHSKTCNLYGHRTLLLSSSENAENSKIWSLSTFKNYKNRLRTTALYWVYTCFEKTAVAMPHESSCIHLRHGLPYDLRASPSVKCSFGEVGGRFPHFVLIKHTSRVRGEKIRTLDYLTSASIHISHSAYTYTSISIHYLYILYARRTRLRILYIHVYYIHVL